MGQDYPDLLFFWCPVFFKALWTSETETDIKLKVELVNLTSVCCLLIESDLSIQGLKNQIRNEKKIKCSFKQFMMSTLSVRIKDLSALFSVCLSFVLHCIMP